MDQSVELKLSAPVKAGEDFLAPGPAEIDVYKRQILGAGAVRMSAAGLLDEIRNAEQEVRSEYLDRKNGEKNYLLDGAPEEVAKTMEAVSYTHLLFSGG